MHEFPQGFPFLQFGAQSGLAETSTSAVASSRFRRITHPHFLCSGRRGFDAGQASLTACATWAKSRLGLGTPYRPTCVRPELAACHAKMTQYRASFEAKRSRSVMVARSVAL